MALPCTLTETAKVALWNFDRVPEKHQSAIEPRTLGGCQMLYDKTDQRITDLVEEGIERGAPGSA